MTDYVRYQRLESEQLVAKDAEPLVNREVLGRQKGEPNQ
jgi:hypothetical protein